MGMTRLEDWLRRIAEDGDAAAVDAARALLRTDERIPEELRYVLDDPEDRPGAADALLFLLGEGESLVAEAIRAEAGSAMDDDLTANPIEGVPVADAVRAEAGTTRISGAWLADAIPVDEAIRAEAGLVDVADAVAGALGFGIPMVQGALRWGAGAVDVAEAVVGAGPPVAAAVRASAGRVEIAASVLVKVGVDVPPVSHAVRDAAGTVAVADVVMAGIVGADLPEGWMAGVLDRELPDAVHVKAASRIAASSLLGAELTGLASAGTRLRAAVEAGAGTVSLWDGVAKSIGIADPEAVTGWDGAAVRAAVLDEAGSVDVVRRVMAKVRRSSAAPSERPEPRPANSAYWVAAAVAVAATILIVFGFSGIERMPSPGRPAPDMGAPGMVFAKADEIRVDDLNYADDATVQVIQEDGADAAMIIWVDEGKTL